MSQYLISLKKCRACVSIQIKVTGYTFKIYLNNLYLDSEDSDLKAERVKELNSSEIAIVDVPSSALEYLNGDDKSLNSSLKELNSSKISIVDVPSSALEYLKGDGKTLNSSSLKDLNSSKIAIVDGASSVLKYLKGNDKALNSSSLPLRDLTIKMLEQLHHITKKHWEQQHIVNKGKLHKILTAAESATLVHDHSVTRSPRGNAKKVYETHTIELCVLTDPYLFDFIKVITSYQGLGY